MIAMGGGKSGPQKPIYKVAPPTLDNPPTVAMDAVAARNAAKAGEAEAVGDRPAARLNAEGTYAVGDRRRSKYAGQAKQSSAGAIQGLRSSTVLTG